MQKETQDILTWFTKREDQLLAIVTERGLTLPVRLAQWRTWIGDPVIYLNELNTFVVLNPPKA